MDWEKSWEKHIDALQDISKIGENFSTLENANKKQAGAFRRAKNSYIKMLKIDPRLTRAIYPFGWYN